MTNTTNIYFTSCEKQTLNEKEKRNKQRESMASDTSKLLKCFTWKCEISDLLRIVSNWIEWERIILALFICKKDCWKSVKVKTKCDVRCKYFVSFENLLFHWSKRLQGLLNNLCVRLSVNQTNWRPFIV